MAKQLAAYYHYSVSPVAGAPAIPVGTWTGWSGGEASKNSTAHHEGGTRGKTYRGKASFSNIILRTGYDADRDATWLPRVEKAFAEGDVEYTITRQPTTNTGALRGKPEVHTGAGLVAIRRPESVDGTDATVGILELEFTTDGPK